LTIKDASIYELEEEEWKHAFSVCVLCGKINGPACPGPGIDEEKFGNRVLSPGSFEI
jgi:hypothetical protein